jgi:hypothetical protein
MPVNMPNSNQNKGRWHPRRKFSRYPSTNFGLTVGCPQSHHVTLQQVAITYFLLTPSHLISTQSKQQATLYGTTYRARTARSRTPTSATLNATTNNLRALPHRHATRQLFRILQTAARIIYHSSALELADCDAKTQGLYINCHDTALGLVNTLSRILTAGYVRT